MSSSMRIAILPQGGKQWIAGIIYTHNLIRAIHCLPEKERPELHFFMGPWDDPRHHRELGHLRPSAHYYCFRARTPGHDKLYDIKNSLLRLRWPSSLEGLAIKLRPKVLFLSNALWERGFPLPGSAGSRIFSTSTYRNFSPRKNGRTVTKLTSGLLRKPGISSSAVKMPIAT